MVYERQKQHHQKRQQEGWARVSALLEPEYVAMAKQLAENRGSLANVLREALSDLDKKIRAEGK